MSQPKLKPALTLSILIAVLAALASAGGLLLPGLYRDNAFVRTTWLGNDTLTLFVAVPILIIALVFSARGSVRARLLWMGSLDYMLYNYAFYLFGTAFNWFFLLYTVLLALSIMALIFGLANLDLGQIDTAAQARMPVGWIGGYFLFVAAGLTTVYVIQSLAFVATGTVPGIVVTSGHPTSIVFAQDLTLLRPWFILGALWLIRRKPWGYVITGILSVKGPLYTLVLAVNSILVLNAGLVASNEVPLWGTLTVLGLIASILFYVNIR